MHLSLLGVIDSFEIYQKWKTIRQEAHLLTGQNTAALRNREHPTSSDQAHLSSVWSFDSSPGAHPRVPAASWLFKSDWWLCFSWVGESSWAFKSPLSEPRACFSLPKEVGSVSIYLPQSCERLPTVKCLSMRLEYQTDGKLVAGCLWAWYRWHKWFFCFAYFDLNNWL